MSKNKLYYLLAGLVALALIVSACGGTPTPTTEPTEAAPAVDTAATDAAMEAAHAAETQAAGEAMHAAETQTAADAAATEAAAPKLGSPEFPITMAIAPSATTDELIASGNTIADLLSQETGLTIKAVIPTNYKAMIEAMCSGNAQVGWLPPFGYLVAHETKAKDAAGNEVTCADVAFVTLRNGLDHYATQYIARAADGYTAGTDLSALKQFEGKKPCWTDQFSASGYVIPASLLAQEGVKAKTAAFVQGHPTVVRAVYAGGICDFGATFVDARTNSAIQTDLPDVNEKVIVVYQTENIIPNDTLGYAYDLSPELRDQISAAMEKIAGTEAGADAMKKLYSIDGLQATDDTFFDEFRVLLAASGIDVAALVR
ncbi:MAG: phosphate/phosphite/phosphonate ABC transporter substrate-binding protein [Chloroflexota bacterium]